MLILFSDLDGTILDDHTYSFDRSLPGIALLRSWNVPVVLASSKTFDEMIIFHRELKLKAPFIFENGGGIAWPDGNGSFSAEIIGRGVEELRAALQLIESALGAKITSIMEMPLEELMRRTELPADQAELARLRRSSVPFAVRGEDSIPPEKLEEANRLLAPRSCGVIRGKRFFHLTALGVDKGAAVRRITEYYRGANPGTPVVTWGVGDSYNDLPLFSAVDAAVFVGSDPAAVAGIPGLLRTRASGPEGFTEAVKMIAEREGYSTF